mmetsp:Transcript_165735/g.532154  ORF Transcript_165735/g.532154 Transcript_165735/m.532154 type:complete len:205 (+) Transcript_165735:1370-1984(+)
MTLMVVPRAGCGHSFRGAPHGCQAQWGSTALALGPRRRCRHGRAGRRQLGGRPHLGGNALLARGLAGEGQQQVRRAQAPTRRLQKVQAELPTQEAQRHLKVHARGVRVADGQKLPAPDKKGREESIDAVLRPPFHASVCQGSCKSNWVHLVAAATEQLVRLLGKVGVGRKASLPETRDALPEARPLRIALAVQVPPEVAGPGSG